MLQPWGASVMFALKRILRFLLPIVVLLGLVRYRIGLFVVRTALLRLSRSQFWGINGLDELFRCNRSMVQNLHILFGFLFRVGVRPMDFYLDILLGLIPMESILDFVMFDDLLLMCSCFVRFVDFDLIVNLAVDFFHGTVCFLDFLGNLGFLYQFDLLAVGVLIADMFVLFGGLSIQFVGILSVELVWL